MGEKYKLDCAGCGAPLHKSDIQQVYICDRCGTSYKIKFDEDGVSITEIEEKVQSLEKRLELQNKLFYLENKLKQERENYKIIFKNNKNDYGIGCATLGLGIILIIVGIAIANELNRLNLASILTSMVGILLIWASYSSTIKSNKALRKNSKMIYILEENIDEVKGKLNI